MLFDPLLVSDVLDLRRQLTRGSRAFARRLGMPVTNVTKVSLTVLSVVLLVVALMCVDDYRRSQTIVACNFDDIAQLESQADTAEDTK